MGLETLERVAVMRIASLAAFASLCACLALAAPVRADEGRPAVLVVVGAPGTDEYGQQFHEWAGRLKTAADRGQAAFTAIGLGEEAGKADRDRLKDWLAKQPPASSEALWLILIGHGTFDGKTARFNLRGPDVSSAELAEWLKPFQRPLAIINCASASGPFLNELSGKNRVVIAATRSGYEHNLTRFGEYFSAAIADPQADLDKDQQVSLLEAFLSAAAGVREFYASDARLATEHPLLDDNGDKLGTPADWFQGVRVTKTAKEGATPDGLRAGQMHLVRSSFEEQLPPAVRERRDQLERDLAALKQRKSKLPEAEYLGQLEPILLELARLYEPGAGGEGGFTAPPNRVSK